MGVSPKSLLGLVSWALIGCAATAAALSERDATISAQDTFNVDLVVIGGGAAGTYAAIKAKDLGKSVVVVEQQNRLGGHTQTYIDPTTKQPVELGVAEYEDIPPVRQFFARFNVPLYTFNYTTPGVTSEDADFATGKVVTPKQTGDLVAGWKAFQTQVAKYPTLFYSLDNVPYPVPADLLLPFGDFIRKYNLEPAVPYLSLYGQGWGNFTTLPTLLAVKYFPPYFFDPASLFGQPSSAPGALAAKDNSLIYDKATVELGRNVLLSSTVSSMDRSAKDQVTVTVQTPSGKKLVCAKKLVAAIPPLIDNLKGFDLNSDEVPIFNKFQGHSWYIGLVQNSGIPDNLTLSNYGSTNDANFNIPVLPAVSNIYATAVPGLHYFLFEGPDSEPTFTKDQVVSALKATLDRLRSAGTIPKQAPSQPLNIIQFDSHTPYEVFVPADQIAQGFYNKLFDLQGKRNTYWTGAAFVTHSSAGIWNYTDTLVTGIFSK